MYFYAPFCHLILLIALLLLQVSAAATGIRVVYSAGEIQNDTRFNDVIELLCTSLEKTKARFGPFECLHSPKVLPKKRALLELEQPLHSINVIWNPTSVEMEQRFSAIRIPLRKGLLGYRIALIRQQDQSKIDQIKTVDDLKKFTLGQGVGWTDNLLYEAQGIHVDQAPYAQLFKMLSMHRFDIFPRGVGEIFAEYAQNAQDNPQLAIEKNLLIYYPFPYYFFFNKKDIALKDRVEAGLQIMRKDGSFDAVFNKYHRASIEKANLKGRRMLRLTNPFLPEKTPLSDASLWYIPEK